MGDVAQGHQKRGIDKGTITGVSLHPSKLSGRSHGMVTELERCKHIVDNQWEKTPWGWAGHTGVPILQDLSATDMEGGKSVKRISEEGTEKTIEGKKRKQPIS